MLKATALLVRAGVWWCVWLWVSVCAATGTLYMRPRAHTHTTCTQDKPRIPMRNTEACTPLDMDSHAQY